MSEPIQTDTLHLLDTNIISDLMRHPAGEVALKIKRLAEAHARAMSMIDVRDLPASAAPIEFRRVSGLAVENWLKPDKSI